MKKLNHYLAVSLVFALLLLAGCGESILEVRVADLEAQVADLQAELDAVILLNQYLTISSATIVGLAGPHVIFEGVNVHIRNGDDATDTINGVGNLVVGYNEEPFGGLDPGDRGGSHNLIVGPEHRYLSYGGLLAGISNTVSGDFSSVSGGAWNTASSFASSVSGGDINYASGFASSVSGGESNTASGIDSSVIGGFGNTASGYFSSVSGGIDNTASSNFSSCHAR